ncbi:MAG: hypothetical protein IKI97_13190 [Clostridia bacterium]|nr:hypothetical protein [Clostridia bacterium]
MKKYLGEIVGFILSGVVALIFFGVALVVAMTLNNSADKPAVYFSEDGDVLHFFGETLYISENSLKKISAYPGRASEFCISFMPQTLKRYSEYFTDIAKESAEQLLSTLNQKFQSLSP